MMTAPPALQSLSRPSCPVLLSRCLPCSSIFFMWGKPTPRSHDIPPPPRPSFPIQLLPFFSPLPLLCHTCCLLVELNVCTFARIPPSLHFLLSARASCPPAVQGQLLDGCIPPVHAALVEVLIFSATRNIFLFWSLFFCVCLPL